MVQLDTMHVLDHHGIIALATGALLATALRGKEVAQTQPATLTYLNNHLRAFYRRNRVQHRVGNIRVSNIFNGKRAATTARRTGGGQEPASLEGGLCGRDNLTAGRAARGGGRQPDPDRVAGAWASACGPGLPRAEFGDGETSTTCRGEAGPCVHVAWPPEAGKKVFPTLRGTRFKAASVKALLPWAAQLEASLARLTPPLVNVAGWAAAPGAASHEPGKGPWGCVGRAAGNQHATCPYAAARAMWPQCVGQATSRRGGRTCAQAPPGWLQGCGNRMPDGCARQAP